MQPRQRRKVPEGELCAVCSDRATGYHYGTPSCNGCKTFFRRTIVSGHTFVCQYNGNCDVNKNVRCACRHCRFNKCVAVGMDARAIQNDRDRIGPTKKFRMAKTEQNSSADDDQMSMSSMSPQRAADEKVIELLNGIENLCNTLRTCALDETKSVRETLASPSLLYHVGNIEMDHNTIFKELYPASMNDIQMWNIRELRLCLEWAKTFEEFTKLSESDQLALVRNFGFTFNILNRVFYSLDHGPDKIVYPNGAYILRQPQEQVKIPGCRSIYHRQMDEIMIPFRKLNVSVPEFAAFKASLLFNPDACDLSPEVKPEISMERTKYLSALFYFITNKIGLHDGVQKYGQLLMMAPSIQNIIDQNDENMQVMEVFGHFWRIDRFVKELCMK
jgi:nuclear factor 4